MAYCDKKIITVDDRGATRWSLCTGSVDSQTFLTTYISQDSYDAG